MRPWLIAVAFLLTPSLLAAQPADSLATDPPPTPLRAGVWALQFDVNGQLLDFSGFAGGVSLKRHFSQRSALRFGVGFGLSDAERERDSSSFPGSEDDIESQYVRVETVYQRYLNAGGVVSAYWCLGPFASFDKSSMASETDSTSSEHKGSHWSTGLTAAFGAEWFFARQFSLHAEFTGNGYYFAQENESLRREAGTPEFQIESESDGWSVGTSNYVRLGLSAYF